MMPFLVAGKSFVSTFLPYNFGWALAGLELSGVVSFGSSVLIFLSTRVKVGSKVCFLDSSECTSSAESALFGGVFVKACSLFLSEASVG